MGGMAGWLASNLLLSVSRGQYFTDRTAHFATIGVECAKGRRELCTLRIYDANGLPFTVHCYSQCIC